MEGSIPSRAAEEFEISDLKSEIRIMIPSRTTDVDRRRTLNLMRAAIRAALQEPLISDDVRMMLVVAQTHDERDLIGDMNDEDAKREAAKVQQSTDEFVQKLRESRGGDRSGSDRALGVLGASEAGAGECSVHAERPAVAQAQVKLGFEI